MSKRTILALAVALAAILAVSAGAQTMGEPLRLTAWAVNMSNIGTGANSTVTIQIDRWSTDAERETLVTTFMEQGPQKLLSALQKMKRVGFIRLPNSIGYDLQFARQAENDEGGRRIFVATDRRIGAREAMNQPRSIDYPFTLIEVRLDKDGKGEGKMSIATKITWDKKANSLVLENYASEPVRLQNVKAETITK